MAITIRYADEGDLDAVFQISRSLGDVRDPQKGFLVSDYSMETYQAFFAASHNGPDKTKVSFILACDETTHDPIGFMIAYSSSFIEPSGLFDTGTTEQRLLEKFGKDPAFTVIKQVAVDANHIGQGVGSRLYDALLHMLTGRQKSDFAEDAIDPAQHSSVCDVFVAVVRKPENERSTRFHRSYGFLPVLTFGNLIGQDELEREVLHVTAQTALQFKRNTLDFEAGVSGLRTSLDSARQLYLHEDNLNWTKLQYLSQYFVLLIAAQFILPTLAPTLPETIGSELLLVVHVGLSALLFYVLNSFSAKIKSGLNFMASHKRAVLMTEAKLQHQTAAFYPSVSRVPRQSRTVILIRFARIIFGSVLVLSFIVNLLILLEI